VLIHFFRRRNGRWQTNKVDNVNHKGDLINV
jgi:hypothetical protein